MIEPPIALLREQILEFAVEESQDGVDVFDTVPNAQAPEEIERTNQRAVFGLERRSRK